MSRLNVDRMRRHVARTTPDLLRVHEWDDNYAAKVEAWQDRMIAKHGQGAACQRVVSPDHWVTLRVVGGGWR